MKILVTGSSGFIGKFMIDKLIEKGHEVLAMDVTPPDKSDHLKYFVLGDIANTKDIMKCTKGVDAIIHLAAKHHDFGISRKEFFDCNVGGTKNLLDCASKQGIRKFIFYSTVAVYGTQNSFTTEETKPAPESNYGESKLAAENQLHKWVCRDPWREAVVIRPTVVFGPQNYANMYNLINSIYKKRFLFVGRGENIKSVAYVENLVAATIFLLSKMEAGMQVYNYSDYPQMTTNDIVTTISTYLAYSLPKWKLPLVPTLMTAGIFDIMGKLTGYNFPITANRIKKFNAQTCHKSNKIRELGFLPPVELKEGFRRMVEWYLGKEKTEETITREVSSV